LAGCPWGTHLGDLTAEAWLESTPLTELAERCDGQLEWPQPRVTRHRTRRVRRFLTFIGHSTIMTAAPTSAAHGSGTRAPGSGSRGGRRTAGESVEHAKLSSQLKKKKCVGTSGASPVPTRRGEGSLLSPDAHLSTGDLVGPPRSAPTDGALSRSVCKRTFAQTVACVNVASWPLPSQPPARAWIPRSAHLAIRCGARC
jgi:hypothetical protein